MMDSQKKEFTGVWIPKEIADDYSLNAYEKILYVEIASFPVCYMLNKTLGERIGASEKTVSRYIKTLTDKGYIQIVKNDGRKRFVRAVRDFPVTEVTIKECEGIDLPGQIVQSDRTNCPGSMDRLSTIDNNREYIKDIYDVSEKEGPVYELTLVPDEDQLPTSTFGKKKRTKEVPQTKLATCFMDELVDRQGIPSLDGYNPKTTAEKVVETFKLSLQTVLKFDKAELTDEVIMTQWGLFLDLVKTKNSFHWQNMTSMSYVNNNLQKIIKSIM